MADLLAGRPFEATTPAGNPLNPFYAPIEIPLILLFRPSYWITRAPSVLSGILAVALTYVLGRRIFDRPTALIAAVLMAVLPIAIINGLFGGDPAQIPLAGIVALYFAFRKNAVGL